MERGDLGIEKYFSQLKTNELPKDMKPKFSVGDLVKIVFGSDDGISSYRLEDDMGLVCEVSFYECRDYGIDDYEDKNPFFLIEYKILVSSKADKYRYVSEEHLRFIDD